MKKDYDFAVKVNSEYNDLPVDELRKVIAEARKTKEIYSVSGLSPFKDGRMLPASIKTSWMDLSGLSNHLRQRSKHNLTWRGTLPLPWIF